MTITRIGPIGLPAVYDDVQVRPSGPVDAVGGVPISVSFVAKDLSLAERLYELVNNRERRQTIGGTRGVLEYVQATGNLARWQGWWLLDRCDVAIDRVQIRTGQWIAVSMTGAFFGEARRPLVVATHRERADDFGVTGQALLVPLYPYPDLTQDAAAAGVSTRAGEGATIQLKTVAETVKIATPRLDTADPTLVGLRPRLRDAAGVAHYGPPHATLDAAGVALETAFIRLTLRAGGTDHWRFEAYTAGTWTVLGMLRVQPTTATGSRRVEIVGATVRDDEVGVALVDDRANELRVSIRHGDLAARIAFVSATYVEWLDPDGTDAGAAALTGNTYEDTADLAGGQRRYIALTNTPAAATPSDWEIQVGSGQQIAVGYRPATPASNDTTLEQGRQFLYDRTQVLTLR